MKRIKQMIDTLLIIITVIVVMYLLATQPERNGAAKRWESEKRKMEIKEAVTDAMKETTDDND